MTKPRQPRQRSTPEAKYAKWLRSYGREFAALRRKWKPLVDAGVVACHEPVCLMQSRLIEPGTPWHLSHAPDGITVIGPSHARCNQSEAAKRGNKNRARQTRRLVL